MNEQILSPDDPFARTAQIFPTLDEEMIRRIRPYGEDCLLDAGSTLYAQGDRHTDFFLIVDGRIGVFLADDDGRERLLTTHAHGQFSGELDHMSARSTLVSARALTPAATHRPIAADQPAPVQRGQRPVRRCDAGRDRMA